MAQRLDVQYIRLYTDGSAARKVAPKVPLKTMKLPIVKPMKRITLRLDPVAIAATCMAVVMLVLMVTGVAQLKQEQRQLQQMSSYVEDLRVENALLEDKFQSGYHIEEVERTALALGMVPADQVRQVTLQVPDMETEQEPGSWERFYIFLTGLFA